MDFFDAITGGVQRELFKSTLPKPPEDMFDKIINQPKEEVELTQPSILEPEVSPLTDRAKAAAEMGITVLNQLNRPYSAVSGGLQEFVREYKKPTKADEGVLSRAMSLGVTPFVGAVKGFATNDKSFGTVLRQVVSGENYTNAINTIDKAIADVNKNLVSTQNPAEKETLKKRLSELQDVQGKLAGLTGIVDTLKTEEGQEALEPLTGGVGQIVYDPLMFGAALLPKTAKGKMIEEIGKEAPTVMQQIGKGERTVLGFNEGATPATNAMAKLFPKTMKTVTGAADTVRGKIDEAISAVARGASEAGEAIASPLLRAKEELKRMVFNRTDNKDVNDAVESMVRRINKGDDEIIQMAQDAAQMAQKRLSGIKTAEQMAEEARVAAETRPGSLRSLLSQNPEDYYVGQQPTPSVADIFQVMNRDNVIGNIGTTAPSEYYSKLKSATTSQIADNYSGLLEDIAGELSPVGKISGGSLFRSPEVVAKAKATPLTDAEKYALINYALPNSTEKLSSMRKRAAHAPTIKTEEKFNTLLKDMKANPDKQWTYGDFTDNVSVVERYVPMEFEEARNAIFSAVKKLDLSPEIEDIFRTAGKNINGEEIGQYGLTASEMNRLLNSIDKLPPDKQGKLLSAMLNSKMAVDDRAVAREAMYRAVADGGDSVGKFIIKGGKVPEGYRVPRLAGFEDMALKDKYADFIEQTYENVINKRISTPILDLMNKANNMWKQSVTTGLGIPNISFSVANTLSEVLKNAQAGVGFKPYVKAYNQLADTAKGFETQIMKLAKEHNIVDSGFIAEDLGKSIRDGMVNVKFSPATTSNLNKQMFYNIKNMANDQSIYDLQSTMMTGRPYNRGLLQANLLRDFTDELDKINMGLAEFDTREWAAMEKYASGDKSAINAIRPEVVKQIDTALDAGITDIERMGIQPVTSDYISLNKKLEYYNKYGKQQEYKPIGQASAEEFGTTVSQAEVDAENAMRLSQDEEMMSKYRDAGVDYAPPTNTTLDSLMQRLAKISGAENDLASMRKGLGTEILIPVKNEKGVLGSLKIMAKDYANNPFWSRSMGKYTENMARLANFIDKLDKGYTPAAAARQVAKYNFNYGDISKEMKISKLLYPFITFQLKNVPMQLGQLFENPKQLQMLNKLIEAGTTDIDINNYDENAKKAIPVKLPLVDMDAVAAKRFLPQTSVEVAKDIFDVVTGKKGIIPTSAEYLSSNLTPLKSIYEASANTTTPGSSVTQTGGGFDTFTGQPIEAFSGEKGRLLGKKTEHIVGNIIPQYKRAFDWYDALTGQGKHTPEKMEQRGATGIPVINKLQQEVTGYRKLPENIEGVEREERGKLQEVYRLKKLLRKYDESGEDDKFNQVEQLLEDLIDSLDENEVLQYKQMEKTETPEAQIEPFRQLNEEARVENVEPYKMSSGKIDYFTEITEGKY